MMKLVNVLTVNPDALADRAKEAGIVSLQGMVTIFAVLALLWLVIEILHRALSGNSGVKKEETVQEEKKPQKPAPAKREAPKKAETPAPTAPVAPAASVDDGAIVAAITAAISAALAEDGYTGGFRVVSFKRASTRRNGRA